MLLLLFWWIVVPLLVLLLAVIAAASVYFHVKLGAGIADVKFLKGIFVPRIEQIFAAKKNKTTDDYWYSQYNSRDKNAPMMIQAEDDSRFTWGQMEAFSNRIANFAIAQKWPVGTTVGLFLPNRPEFVGTWLGLCKVWKRGSKSERIFESYICKKKKKKKRLASRPHC